MAGNDLYVKVNLHAVIGGDCRWTRLGQFLEVPFYVAECGGSGAIPSIVRTFEFCPFCGLKIKL